MGAAGSGLKKSSLTVWSVEIKDSGYQSPVYHLNHLLSVLGELLAEVGLHFQDLGLG